MVSFLSSALLSLCLILPPAEVISKVLVTKSVGVQVIKSEDEVCSWFTRIDYQDTLCLLPHHYVFTHTENHGDNDIMVLSLILSWYFPLIQRV